MNSHKKGDKVMENRGSFTDFFIQKPVFSWVVNIIVILMGVTSFFSLGTRQYPLTEGSLVTVRATMDASAKIMENQITKPLEDSFSSLTGLESMTSNTEKNEAKLFLGFKGRSMDAAVSDVRNSLDRARKNLPSGVDVEVSKGNIDAPSMMNIVVTGASLSDVSYAAEKNIKPIFESVNGVAQVEVFGARDVKMKVTLDRLKLSSYGVAASDVVHALQGQNFTRSAGRIVEPEREFILTTDASLKTPKEFGNILVSPPGTRPVRLSDVANVDIDFDEEDVKVLYNGKPSVSLTVRAQSGANPVDISQEMQRRMNTMRLPQGVKAHIVVNKANYIQESIAQVYKTLIEAVVLVVLVMLVFLQSFRSSIVPLVTIPISLIGSFFVMRVLGFSINSLSLMALVLAIGLVVDDAIVVLENIYRYWEEGETPFQAAIKGTREIRFSVIAMTLTLAAVYAPIALASGDIGKLFGEFALTLAGAVILSGFTALTLSPFMCVQVLKGGRNWRYAHIFDTFFSFFEKSLKKIDDLYKSALNWSFKRRIFVLSISAVFSLFSALFGIYVLKKEVSPPIDEGLLMARIYAPPSANLSYVENRVQKIQDVFHKEKEIDDSLIVLQSGQDSIVTARLRPWSKRSTFCRDISRRNNEKLEDVLGLTVSSFCPSGSVLATSGSGQFPLRFSILTSKPVEELNKVGRSIRHLLRSYPGIDRVDLSEVIQQDEIEIHINRDRAHKLGIDLDEIAQTIQTLVRGSRVGRFERDGRSYPVHVRIQAETRRSLDAVSSVFVRSRHQKKDMPVMVPLSELISFKNIKGPPMIFRSMKGRAYHIDASVKEGYGIVDVYESFKKDVVDRALPSDYSIQPSGELDRYYKDRKDIYLIFGLALLFIFLVMAAQFESIRDPFVILLSAPLALSGGILSLGFVYEGSLNVYSQIGLITLIGLITKHGILIVDFANQKKAAGESIQSAVKQACFLRLRPILMTTCAMVLGAVPLMFASGAGFEMRRQIGTVVVWGMTIGTLFTLFVVPILYTMLSKRKA
jgi:multidrug efflux pump